MLYTCYEVYPNYHNIIGYLYFERGTMKAYISIQKINKWLLLNNNNNNKKKGLNSLIFLTLFPWLKAESSIGFQFENIHS